MIANSLQNETACNTDTITLQCANGLCNLLTQRMGEHAVNENETRLKWVILKWEIFILISYRKCDTHFSVWSITRSRFITDSYTAAFSEDFCSDLLLSPSLFDWHHDCCIMMTLDLNLQFSTDKGVLAFSLRSIILFFCITGSHLNQITTKGIKMTLFLVNYRPWQSFSRYVGWIYRNVSVLITVTVTLV